MKTQANQQPTLSLSQYVYGDLSLDFKVRLRQGVVRNERPFVVSGVREMVKPVSLGRTVKLPRKPKSVSEPELIEVEFDENEVHVNPQYNGRVADNEFVVDQDVIDNAREMKDRLEKPIRESMSEMVALLYAADDAANYVEATMRDGVGFEVERDSHIEDALVPITRLSVLSSILKNVDSLDDSVKRLMINQLASKTVDEIIASLTRRKSGDALAALHKQYAATVRGAGVEPDLEDSNVSSIGVRTSRR